MCRTQYCRTLQQLNVSQTKLLTDETVLEIARHAPSLRVLILFDCIQGTPTLHTQREADFNRLTRCLRALGSLATVTKYVPLWVKAHRPSLYIRIGPGSGKGVIAQLKHSEIFQWVKKEMAASGNA